MKGVCGGGKMNVTVRRLCGCGLSMAWEYFLPPILKSLKIFSEIYSNAKKLCQFRWKCKTMLHVWVQSFLKLVAGGLVTTSILAFKRLHYWRYRICALHKNTTSDFINSRQTAGNKGRATLIPYSLPKPEYYFWITMNKKSKNCSKMPAPIYQFTRLHESGGLILSV
jgi:hypothetical protein